MKNSNECSLYIGDNIPQAESREDIEIKWKDFIAKHPEILETCKRMEERDYDQTASQAK